MIKLYTKSENTSLDSKIDGKIDIISSKLIIIKNELKEINSSLISLKEINQQSIKDLGFEEKIDL